MRVRGKQDEETSGNGDVIGNQVTYIKNHGMMSFGMGNWVTVTTLKTVNLYHPSHYAPSISLPQAQLFLPPITDVLSVIVDTFAYSRVAKPVIVFIWL